MIHAVVDLTVKDCKNILLWYELYFKKKNKPTQADINTYTKMKALAISGKEEDDRYNRIRVGRDD
ncbi:hypothetical protein OAJ88_03515 [Candidatus Nitrosopelagicus sp.]|jgi:hypothetical protein|nr:hypothetical protein [Candidatus Nitrosopelagicus sp.]